MSRIGVLHMIDTLEPGGYERVAVNLVNQLPRDRYVACLCTTRRGGPLEAEVAPDVERLRLERRHSIDMRAIRRLADFNVAHRVGILHAHGASLFLARLAAALPPYPAVVWHAHCGRVAAEDRAAWSYRFAAVGIAGVIAVNRALLAWSRRRLPVPAARTWRLPNLVAEPPRGGACPQLPGTLDSRVVAVANLRPEKDHSTLLRAFAQAAGQVPEARLLLVGAETDSRYAARLRAETAALGIAGRVDFLGCRTDVPAILSACAVGVLSSVFEGLPMSLLEYGMANLATVATTAGESAEVLDNGRAGILAPPGDAEALAAGLVSLLRSPARRACLGGQLGRHVRACYGPPAVMGRLCSIYETVLES